jgi:hypothetical protein
MGSFLAKAHEKNVSDVRERLGEDAMLYDAITWANRRSTVASNLLGGEPKPIYPSRAWRNWETAA